MTRLDDATIARLLEEAGSDASWPPIPDLRQRVMARIGGSHEGSPGGVRAPDLRAGVVLRIRGEPGVGPIPSSAVAGRRLLRPLLLAAVLVVAFAGITAGLGFRLPGLLIERVPGTPPAGAALDLGTPIPIEEALAAEAPHVLLPSVLPRPDTAYRIGSGRGSIVTVAWRAGAGQRTLTGSDLSLSLMAVSGSMEEELLRKMIGEDTRIESVSVDGARGWWIEGAPHEILIFAGDGSVAPLRSAVVGDTLVFTRGGTLYRLESSLGKAATLEIAASLR